MLSSSNFILFIYLFIYFFSFLFFSFLKNVKLNSKTQLKKKKKKKIFKRANKRLYALRLLVRSKVPAVDLIAIYCALVRSILQYGSPVWAALPEYLSDVVEGVQRKALRIIFPSLAYSEALVASGLRTLATRRGQACVKFLHDVRAQEPLRLVLTSTASQRSYHGYTLRSGNTNLIRQPCNTKRLCEFVTYKYL